MSSEKVSMKAGNKGLTVKINLWPPERYLKDFDSEAARLWIKGVVTNADSKEELKFNDAGQLLSILGKWNVVKFKDHKKRSRGT
jgi:hypothetical protein